MSGILSGAYELADPPCSLDAHTYIECGLENGFSFQNALDHKPSYERLVGIEVCDRHYKTCSDKFANERRVELHHGSTVDVLPRVIDPTVSTVWLIDSHYTGNHADAMSGKDGQCPLLKELEIIASVRWNVRPTLLIHDASMLVGTKFWDNAPKDFKRNEWPDLIAILKAVEPLRLRWDVRRDFVWMW